ncbi:MAG: YHYH protein [Planctomycetota bacterium]
MKSLLPSSRHWKILFSLVLVFTGITSIGFAVAQFGRRHTAIKSKPLKKIAATQTPSVASQVTIQVKGSDRVIQSNGVPSHQVGAFPNPGNPNRIRAQRYEYRVPAKPVVANEPTPLGGVFGIAINGVPFDPGAAEFFNGQMGSRWQYEPLAGAIALGIDVSHAHVQPNGAYHYHGLPTGLLDEVKLDKNKHSPLIGWAADGFPIYAVYGYQDAKNPESSVAALRSSYQLRSGKRPGGREPDGKYDGTFVADYEYVEGSGDLDQCNGRFTATPEFPEGTYAYFLSEAWPVVPRNFKGTPSADFMRRGPGGPGFGPPGGSRRGGPGGRRRGPPTGRPES